MGLLAPDAFGGAGLAVVVLTAAFLGRGVTFAAAFGGGAFLGAALAGTTFAAFPAAAFAGAFFTAAGRVAAGCAVTFACADFFSAKGFYASAVASSPARAAARSDIFLPGWALLGLLRASRFMTPA